MKIGPQFHYPKDNSLLEWGANEVLNGGYKMERLTFEKLGRPPVVLDLGGNCGSFSRWATDEWPGCTIIAVEPHPKNIPYFRKNNPNVQLIEGAVVAADYPDPEVVLYDGVDGGESGSGQASIECRGGQHRHRQFSVKAISAATLPPCDFFKLDIEGVERAVLQGYKHLAGVAAIALEFHYRADQFHIGSMLETAGFHCVGQKIDKQDDYFGRHSGVLKFLRPAFMVKCTECHGEDGRRRGYRRADGMVECRECDDVFPLADALPRGQG